MAATDPIAGIQRLLPLVGKRTLVVAVKQNRLVTSKAAFVALRPCSARLEMMGEEVMSENSIKGPASYFPSIEKTYGRPISEWQDLVRQALPAKHMELVDMLKKQHGMGHGHANAVVAYVLASQQA